MQQYTYHNFIWIQKNTKSVTQRCQNKRVSGQFLITHPLTLIESRRLSMLLDLEIYV